MPGEPGPSPEPERRPSYRASPSRRSPAAPPILPGRPSQTVRRSCRDPSPMCRRWCRSRTCRRSCRGSPSQTVRHSCRRPSPMCRRWCRSRTCRRWCPEPDVPPVVPRPEPSPARPRPNPRCRPSCPSTTPWCPPARPGCRPAGPSGRPPTATAAADGDTRAELTWAQTGSQPAGPSADDVPRRTYRPREQPAPASHCWPSPPWWCCCWSSWARRPSPAVMGRG